MPPLYCSTTPGFLCASWSANPHRAVISSVVSSFLANQLSNLCRSPSLGRERTIIGVLNECLLSRKLPVEYRRRSARNQTMLLQPL
jgi:hypothetical protein